MKAPEFPTLAQWLAMTEAQREEATLQHLRHSLAYGRYAMNQLEELYSTAPRRDERTT
jgi:hypothetical protein